MPLLSVDGAVLVSAAFIASLISGTIGMAGGIALLTVMAGYFPPMVLIPLHGTVQLASNSFRTLLHWEAVNWKTAGLFGAGAVIGAAIGSQFIVALPEREFRLGIGIFIIAITFLPKFKVKRKFSAKWFNVAKFDALPGFFGY